MISSRRIPVLLVIAALAWHGVLLTLPHTHDQAGVPRYIANCALVGTGSHAYHLHRLPQPLPPRHCLACLAGSALPMLQGPVLYAAPKPVVGKTVVTATFSAAGTGATLPNRRAPPASA